LYIDNELRHYRDHFRGKAVLCNCDDPRVSNFFYYFAYNFEKLGLKRLITTCYKNQNPDLFSAEYPKYDNYDAIEVSKVADIPMDYDALLQAYQALGITDYTMKKN
jgi:hypothetical protein